MLSATPSTDKVEANLQAFPILNSRNHSMQKLARTWPMSRTDVIAAYIYRHQTATYRLDRNIHTLEKPLPNPWGQFRHRGQDIIAYHYRNWKRSSQVHLTLLNKGPIQICLGYLLQHDAAKFTEPHPVRHRVSIIFSDCAQLQNQWDGTRAETAYGLIEMLLVQGGIITDYWGLWWSISSGSFGHISTSLESYQTSANYKDVRLLGYQQINYTGAPWLFLKFLACWCSQPRTTHSSSLSEQNKDPIWTRVMWWADGMGQTTGMDFSLQTLNFWCQLRHSLRSLGIMCLIELHMCFKTCRGNTFDLNLAPHKRNFFSSSSRFLKLFHVRVALDGNWGIK